MQPCSQASTHSESHRGPVCQPGALSWPHSRVSPLPGTLSLRTKHCVLAGGALNFKALPAPYSPSDPRLQVSCLQKGLDGQRGEGWGVGRVQQSGGPPVQWCPQTWVQISAHHVPARGHTSHGNTHTSGFLSVKQTQ